MTREEAIEWIKSLAKTMINETHGSFPDPEYRDEVYEALDMAIKALEQEPKILDVLDFAIDASNGDTNYFVGFRNGLRYSKSLIDEEEPQFESCTEQEPKTGHWIKSNIPNEKYVCSECGGACWYYDCQTDVAKSRYCPNCGASMVEPQERSDKE